MVKLLHRSAVLFFCLFLVFTIAAPAAARQGNEAGEEARDKVVRVGWFESPFNTIDKSGRRSGYGYEYQLKLAAYTGWTYQYISGSWTELLQMLEKGEIDLLSDVSYKAEREGSMSFSSLPMGTEEYYLFSQYHQLCWWFAIAPLGQIVIPPKGGLANRSLCYW